MEAVEKIRHQRLHLDWVLDCQRGLLHHRPLLPSRGEAASAELLELTFQLRTRISIYLACSYSIVRILFSQADEFGVSSFFVGLISGVSPLVVVFVSPLLGYFVRIHARPYFNLAYYMPKYGYR